jgi:hypothetical protein
MEVDDMANDVGLEREKEESSSSSALILKE